jgi:hypothetical protein
MIIMNILVIIVKRKRIEVICFGFGYPRHKLLRIEKAKSKMLVMLLSIL